MRKSFKKIFVFLPLLLGVVTISSFKISADKIDEGENCQIVDFGNKTPMIDFPEYDLYTIDDYLKKDRVVPEENLFEYDNSSEYREDNEETNKYIKEFNFWNSQKQAYETMDKDTYIECCANGDDAVIAIDKATTVNTEEKLEDIVNNMEENQDYYEEQIGEISKFATSRKRRNLFQRIGDFIRQLISKFNK